MSSLLEDIAPDLLFLVRDCGFVIRESQYSRIDFGNAYIVLSKNKIYFKISKDRGILSVEVSYKEKTWHLLECVLEYLDSSFYTPRKLWSPPIDKVASAIKANLDSVLKLSSNDFRYAGFLAYEQKKEDEIMAFFENPGE